MKLKTIESLGNLTPGDIIRNEGSGQTYIVIACYPGYVIAIRTIHVSNRDEWKLVKE